MFGPALGECSWFVDPTIKASVLSLLRAVPESHRDVVCIYTHCVPNGTEHLMVSGTTYDVATLRIRILDAHINRSHLRMRGFHLGSSPIDVWSRYRDMV
jgi:hypothetical protein